MTQHDVAILGSGLGGSTLATILARRGLRTLLLERDQHPRRHAPEDVRNCYYDLPPRYFLEVGSFLTGEMWHGLGSAARTIRDAFWSRSRA